MLINVTLGSQITEMGLSISNAYIGMS